MSCRLVRLPSQVTEAGLKLTHLYFTTAVTAHKPTATWGKKEPISPTLPWNDASLGKTGQELKTGQKLFVL